MSVPTAYVFMGTYLKVAQYDKKVSSFHQTHNLHVRGCECTILIFSLNKFITDLHSIF